MITIIMTTIIIITIITPLRRKTAHNAGESIPYTYKKKIVKNVIGFKDATIKRKD